ncbi:MAG: hypothetical protein GC183_16265 [Thiobacillus sp.]|nr:hypothetical protein [Thiobacillus sp.]
MRYALLCAAAALPLLAGCGADISYKMGGNVDQLQIDRKTCGGSDSPAYESCMKAKGWGTIDIKGKDAESDTAETMEEPAPAQSVASAPTAPPAATTTPATTATGAPTTAAVATPAAPAAKPDPRGLSNVKPAKAPKPPRDPNARVTVNSWWKPGASNAHDAIAACVAELGDSHKPDYVKHTASQGLVTCMKKQGWYGL